MKTQTDGEFQMVAFVAHHVQGYDAFGQEAILHNFYSKFHCICSSLLRWQGRESLTQGEDKVADPDESCEELVIEDADVAPDVHVHESKGKDSRTHSAQ